MYQVTEDHARTIIAAMAKKEGITIIPKNKSTFMKVLSYMMPILTGGGIKRDEFMTKYVTTIMDRVYIDDDFYKDPDSALSCFIHEIQHVHDYRKDRIRYNTRYLANAHYRALSEANGESAEYQMRRIYTNSMVQMPSASTVFNSLKKYRNYGLSDDDIESMVGVIRSDLRTLDLLGMVSNESIRTMAVMISSVTHNKP